MGDFHLDADWDRDGRVSATAAERSARTAAPGLILLPNLDVQGRRLPNTVKAESDQTLDADQRTLPLGDSNARKLFVVADKTVKPNDFTVTLLLPEDAEDTVRLNTKAGRRMLGLHGRADPVPYPISPGGNPSALLEAVRLPGSPLGSVRETTVGIQASQSGSAVETEQGVVTIAPLILVGDLATPLRLYMCLDEGENDPSLTEVKAACAAAGVPFMGIPPELHGGDTWVQDQFQLGFCHAPDRTISILLHMPRVRAGFVLGQPAPNLASLVNGHFPSTDLGVCQDFWRRKIKVQDVNGKTQQLKFVDSAALFYAIAGVGAVFGVIDFQLLMLGSPFTGTPPATFAEARVALPKALAQLRAAIGKAKAKAWAGRVTQLNERLKAVEDMVAAVDKAIPLQGNGIGLPLSGGVATVSMVEADELAKRLDMMHDSLNYGGNVEVGPGWPGKIVVGEEPAPADPKQQPREIDPELFSFLKMQGVQPVVAIDTGWLDVGHVDELISFVPDARSAGGAAILRAAPDIAMSILHELRQRFLNGLTSDRYKLFEPYYYSGVSDRRTMVGSFPVTMMLRGKHWLHRHTMGDAAALEPPRIYRLLAEADEKETVSAHRIDYKPGFGSDRHYPAGISILEFLRFEDGTNDMIAKDKIAPVDKLLASEFPASKIIGVPVLFDYSHDLSQRRTSAFTPDLVNLQILGKVVIMPRPYGPRVSLDVAADVLATVLPSDVRGRATKSVLQGKKLDVTVHWARDTHAAALGDAFRDGFPNAKDSGEVAKAIVKANPSAFAPDGDLKSGWHRLIIPEQTVDVFQAYTELVTEPLGLAITWADSWYYHVAFGGIHCATNVLRRPTPPASPWWKLRTSAT